MNSKRDMRDDALADDGISFPLPSYFLPRSTTMKNSISTTTTAFGNGLPCFSHSSLVTAATDCDCGANAVNVVSDRVELLPLPCKCPAWCAAAARYSVPMIDDVVEDGPSDGIEVAAVVAAPGADPMPMLVVVVVVVLVCCRSTPETIAPK